MAILPPSAPVQKITCAGCELLLYHVGQKAVVYPDTAEGTSSYFTLSFTADPIRHSRDECPVPDHFGIIYTYQEPAHAPSD